MLETWRATVKQIDKTVKSRLMSILKSHAMNLSLNRTTKDQRRAETNGRGTAPIGSRCRELSRACFFSRTVASGRGFGQSWMQAELRLEDVDHGQGMSEAELDRS
ncbi:hypothetical protein DY000_02060896 [Brassica cretica]|uniref:Uncharacterized protein n=1 Tax=Brassica cretica TaxID=69181 RepID=A0ABQ7APE1_BRACR|nr:hypothetical protein DY000_02060896 [Brassica cretica]